MINGLPWGLALASGVNTYLPLFLLALFARFGHVVRVSPRFQFLISSEAIIILGLLAACEVMAQKFPVLDNVWDFLHTLLRPLAGAIAAGATLNAQSAFEMAATMLVGGTLAAAAHSAKTSVRLASTSKTFGSGNIVLSIGEDAMVIVGTLLAVYAPYVMLIFVVLFLAAFAYFGPRLMRALAFDFQILAGWFRWAMGRVFGALPPRALEESKLEVTPERLEEFRRELPPGEDLLGVLEGWKRSDRGPRASWLVIGSGGLMLMERRLFRKPKAWAIPYGELSVVRYRSLGLLTKLELLTRSSQSLTLTLRRSHGQLGRLAAGQISQRSGIELKPPRKPLAAGASLAPASR